MSNSHLCWPWLHPHHIGNHVMWLIPWARGPGSQFIGWLSFSVTLFTKFTQLYSVRFWIVRHMILILRTFFLFQSELSLLTNLSVIQNQIYGLLKRNFFCYALKVKMVHTSLSVCSVPHPTYSKSNLLPISVLFIITLNVCQCLCVCNMCRREC